RRAHAVVPFNSRTTIPVQLAELGDVTEQAERIPRTAPRGTDEHIAIQLVTFPSGQKLHVHSHPGIVWAHIGELAGVTDPETLLAGDFLLVYTAVQLLDQVQVHHRVIRVV